MSSLVYIARYENRLGGGWSFQKNFAKGLGEHRTDYFDNADIFFISSASMLPREDVLEAKRKHKKIVLRVDNALKNSRNRNTGMSRMRDFAELSDLVIYQSEWARDTIGRWLSRKGPVILNGIDQEIFHPRTREKTDVPIYMYSRFNRDDSKNWELARFTFQEIFSQQNSELYIVGRFSPEISGANFDFYNNERYKYWGTVTDEQTMANLYRKTYSLIYTYFNDACSNTLIEALSSGCEITDLYGMTATGGASEIISKFKSDGRKYFTYQRMTEEYLNVMV